jgi:hypothetical protein
MSNKLIEQLEDNLQKSIKQSEEAVNKSMKTIKKTEPTLMDYGVVYIIYSLLIAWWATWILPHFTDKQFGYWQLAGAMLLTYVFVLNEKVIWLPYSVCAGATVYIWLFI